MCSEVAITLLYFCVFFFSCFDLLDPSERGVPEVLHNNRYKHRWTPSLSFSHNDKMSRKLFVGGLDFERTTSESLHNHFSQFGEIVEAIVICDKHSGRSKGYGFVTFVSDESAHNALLEPNPVIDGRAANVNIAYTSAKKPFSNSNTSSSSRGSSPHSPKPHQQRHNMTAPLAMQPQFAAAAAAGGPPPSPYGYQLGYNAYGQYAPGPTLFYPMNAAPGFGPATTGPIRNMTDSDLAHMPLQQSRQPYQHPVMYILQPSAGGGYQQQYFVPMSPTLIIEELRDGGVNEEQMAAPMMEPPTMMHHRPPMMGPTSSTAAATTTTATTEF